MLCMWRFTQDNGRVLQYQYHITWMLYISLVRTRFYFLWHFFLQLFTLVWEFRFPFECSTIFCLVQPNKKVWEKQKQVTCSVFFGHIWLQNDIWHWHWHITSAYSRVLFYFSSSALHDKSYVCLSIAFHLKKYGIHSVKTPIIHLHG